MRTLRLVATGTALLIVGGCADDRNILGPTTPTLSVEGHSAALSASRARRIQASGRFVANVDFSTLTLTPRGRNCLLEVNGALVFTGTIEGTATGQTTALVFAPCADVASNPPGTFRDVFKSELEFDGTVDGEAAQAKMLYIGGVEPPDGQIAAHLVLFHGVQGVLDVEAIVAVGGEYSGSVVIR